MDERRREYSAIAIEGDVRLQDKHSKSTVDGIFLRRFFLLLKIGFPYKSIEMTIFLLMVRVAAW
jgi:hypothetical protein